jgi:anaerobic selenocysteine-containing dehydrogenase
VTEPAEERKVQTYCALCIARCGAIATVAGHRFVALDPDPSHPTGAALCAKGRAAPELVYSPQRLLYPMRRTRPKGDPDPGWQRISWDEALDTVASAMRRIADAHGPEAVAFSLPSPSTTAIVDSANWIRRLMNAFGTPNAVGPNYLCGWARTQATTFTFGVGSVHSGSGGAMADIANSGVLMLCGYNPSGSRITHATATAEALKRGMKLIVIDPRHTGFANKADLWLRVKPGTDGALALGLANMMIQRGWFDRAFLRDWSNGPLLVRADTGRLLTERDLTPDGSERRYVAWDAASGGVVVYDPAKGRYEREGAAPSLEGAWRIATAAGEVVCETAFSLYAALCRRYPSEVVAATCWIDRDQIEAAARLIWSARPVSYYAYAGQEQHANTTQTARAMSILYALTGSFDLEGGNVLFPSVPQAMIAGEDLPGAKTMRPAAGFETRPLGPARTGTIVTDALYDAILDDKPYPIRGLIGWGANLLIGRGNVRRGRAALTALDFFVHADLFLTPTAEVADVVLPVASAFEREALRIGFEVNEDAQSHVQLRQAVVPPRGESRSDIEIVVALAQRLGLGNHFWGGDIAAGFRHQLAPSGLTLEALRAAPGGIKLPLKTQHAKYAQRDASGIAAGFATPSRKVEIYSETLLAHGYPPLPEFIESGAALAPGPELAARYPLVLTCAKHALFCDSQNRALPSLRRRVPHPEVELHPQTATERGIAAGDWIAIETPQGSIRARARFNTSLDPRVVSGQSGWWQACPELGLPGYDPFGETGSNYNLLVGSASLDPVSGTPTHRSGRCEIRPAG